MGRDGRDEEGWGVGRDKFNLLSKSLVNGLFLCCIGPKDSKNTKFISMGPLFLGATIFLCIQFFQKIVKLTLWVLKQFLFYFLNIFGLRDLSMFINHPTIGIFFFKQIFTEI